MTKNFLKGFREKFGKILGAEKKHMVIVDMTNKRLHESLRIQATQEDVNRFLDYRESIDKMCYQYYTQGVIDEEDYQFFVAMKLDEVVRVCEYYIQERYDDLCMLLTARAAALVQIHIEDYFEHYHIGDVPEVLQAIEKRYPLLSKAQIQKFDAYLKDPQLVEKYKQMLIQEIVVEAPDAIKTISEHIEKTEDKQAYCEQRTAIIMQALFGVCLGERFMVGKFAEFMRDDLHKLCRSQQTQNIKSFLIKDFFNQTYKRYYTGNASLTTHIDKKVGNLIKNYPNVPSSTKNRHKNKSWYKAMQDEYIKKQLTDRNTIQTDQSGIYVTDTSIIDKDKHEVQWLDYLCSTLEEEYKQDHNRREDERLQSEKKQQENKHTHTHNSIADINIQIHEKKELTQEQKELIQKIRDNFPEDTQIDYEYLERMLKKSGDIRIKSLIPKSYNDIAFVTQVTDRLNTLGVTVVLEREQEEFNTVFTNFSDKTQEKLPQIQEKIKSYIRKSYTEHSEVSMAYIQNILGDGFNNEIVNFIYNLSTELDIGVVELEAAGDEVKGILENNRTDHQREGILSGCNNNSPILSSTLQSITDTPEKLTTELLITICKELGYRFWDEKEFAYYSNKLGLEKEGKEAINIKKKIIKCCTKPQEKIWIPDGGGETKKYEKLKLNRGLRMVKQKRTILRLTDHDTYNNLVREHFTKYDSDFDEMLEESWQSPSSIDPRAV